MFREGVSVVIPVHNGMPFLEQTLNSVRNQSKTVNQICVVENGSTDGTLEFLRNQRDIEIRVQPRLVPPAQNWTDAVRAAKHELVKVVCADDTLEPDCIERQTAILQEFPECPMTVGRRRVILEGGRVLLGAHGLKGFAGLLSGRDAVRAICHSGQNPFGEVSAFLFRTSKLRDHLPWPGSHGYATDLAMYVRLLHNSHIFCDQRVVCSFRVGKSSWSFRSQRNQARDLILLIQELQETGVVTISRFGRRKGIALAKIRQVQRIFLYSIIGFLDRPTS